MGRLRKIGVNAVPARPRAAAQAEEARGLVMGANQEHEPLGHGSGESASNTASLADLGHVGQQGDQGQAGNAVELRPGLRTPLPEDYRAMFSSPRGRRDWGRLKDFISKELSKTRPGGRREKQIRLGCFGLVQLVLQRGSSDLATVSFRGFEGVA